MRPLHLPTLTVSAALAAKTLMNHGKLVTMIENPVRAVFVPRRLGYSAAIASLFWRTP